MIFSITNKQLKVRIVTIKFKYIRSLDVLVSTGGVWIWWNIPAVDSFALTREIGFMLPFIELNPRDESNMNKRRGHRIYSRRVDTQIEASLGDNKPKRPDAR